jgi:protein-tyrosine-phosphatase
MKKVVYVCTHNAGRSQMAEALTNKIAIERGIPVRALSAGTIAGDQLNPSAVEAMEEIGISMAGHAPKLLTAEILEGADRVITMGCGVDAQACPARFLVTEDWGLDDPKGQPIEKVRAIRDLIKERVELLLSEMSSQ